MDGGLTEGIDLPEPVWLPGFPLPEGLIIFHLNENHLDESNILTGFVVKGDPAVIHERLRNDLADGAYETLLAADGFVPGTTDALVVYDDHAEVLVGRGVALIRRLRSASVTTRVRSSRAPWFR